MKKILFILFFLLISTTITANSDEKYNYINDFIDSLSHLKRNYERTIDFENKKYETEIQSGIALMKLGHLAIKELNIAKLLIERHKESKIELINKTASLIYMSYNKLLYISQSTLEVQKEIYNNSEKNRQEQGNLMSKIAALEAESDTTWELLMNASVLSTHIMVSNEPNEKGQLSYLIFTSQQRKNLISKLDNIFGEEIKEGMKKGLKYIDTCGAILRQVLSGGHKSADER